MIVDLVLAGHEVWDPRETKFITSYTGFDRLRYGFGCGFGAGDGAGDGFGHVVKEKNSGAGWGCGSGLNGGDGFAATGVARPLCWGSL